MTRTRGLVPGLLAIVLVLPPGPLGPQKAFALVPSTPADAAVAPASGGASPWLSLALPGLSQGLHGEPWTFVAHLGGTAVLSTGLWAAQNALFYRDSSFVPPEQQAAMVLQGTVLAWLVVGGLSVVDAFRFGSAPDQRASRPAHAPVPSPAPSSGGIRTGDEGERPPVRRSDPEFRPEIPVLATTGSPPVQAPPLPVRRPGGTVEPEQRILEAYDLAARGRMWEAVKRVSRVTEPGWQPKVRALLAEWGPRAAAAGFSEANDALDSGLLEEFDAIAALLARLPLTTDQGRRLAGLRRSRPRF